MAEKFNIEEYITDLTPEQQEKARECKTKEELMDLLAEEDIEIPMDALENVAGGCFTSMLSCPAGGDHDWIRAGALEVKCVKCSKSIGFSELDNLPSQIRDAILEKFKK